MPYQIGEMPPWFGRFDRIRSAINRIMETYKDGTRMVMLGA
jgi:hypothetical protein